MKYTIEGELPHDDAAERAILGSIFIDSKCLSELASVVEADDFFHPAHRAIYEAMVELDRKNSPINGLSVTDALRGTGNLDMLTGVGGAGYLQELTFEIVTTASIAFHGRSVARKAERRAWIAEGAKILTTGLASGKDDAFIADAERGVLALTAKRRHEGGSVTLKSVMKDVVHDIEHRYERRNERTVTGIASGLGQVDLFTLGWQQSDMVVIAGRPSMGKTSLAMCAGVEAARAGHPVLFFSLEMSRKSLVERVISMEGMVNASLLRSGDLDTLKWVQLTKSFGRLADMPLWIDDEGGLRVGEIRSRARRWRMKANTSAMPLIIVDYIGFVRPNTPNSRNREREVAEVSSELKAMAKDMACPVMVVSQLNRAVEKQGDKRPMLSDLRESGSIEQDADVVALLYRDEYYHQAGNGPKGQCKHCEANNQGVAEIIIAKQRNGPTGVAHVGWRAECTKFVNLSNRGDR